MGQQDRRSMFREQRGRDRSDRRFDSRWDDDHDDNVQWGRHQPRQGGDFEDRYAGRGGDESRGDERSQRGQWRRQTYGQGRYEHDDHLRAGGSYGGQYEEGDEDRHYSPHEGTSPRDFGRTQHGSSYYGGRDARGYGYDEGRAQEFDRNFDEGSPSRDWERRARERDERYYSGYGLQPYGGSSRSQRPSFRGRGPKGYERSDERLKEIICERLMEDPDIDASDITVEVRNHEVTLQGFVDDRRTKYEVEELIEQCGGVKDVKNELRVRARGSDSGDTSSRFASSGPDYGTSGMSGIGSGPSGSNSSG